MPDQEKEKIKVEKKEKVKTTPHNIEKKKTIIEEKEKQFLSPYAFPMVAKSKELKQKLMKEFEKREIMTRVIAAGNIIKQPFVKNYKDYFLYSNLDGADYIHDNGFYIGNHQGVTEKDYENVIKIMKEVLYGN